MILNPINSIFTVNKDVIQFYKSHISILRFLIFLLGISYTSPSVGQSLRGNAGVLLNLQVTLGNQNQNIKVGAYGIGVLHYGDIAMESGISLYSGYLLKRHTVKTSGINYGYDVFALVGIGNNRNLLGSSFLKDGALLATPENRQSFYGLGFGFEKEFLPGTLSTFNQRLGKFLARFSNDNYSISFQIKNDFRIGKVFNGEGTDFGATGMFELSYSSILNPNEIYQAGLGLFLFTPNADHSRTPINPLNSDDGCKNVWYTQEPYSKLFYANAYVFGGYQKNHFSGFLKTGINSQKFGAFTQNTLHDSFGLNPRFPWDVTAKDKFYYEMSGSILNTSIIDD